MRDLHRGLRTREHGKHGRVARRRIAASEARACVRPMMMRVFLTEVKRAYRAASMQADQMLELQADEAIDALESLFAWFLFI